MKPGVVIDAFHHLQERYQVLSAQVQLAAGSTEVKTAIRGEFAFRILTPMARHLSTARCDPDAHGLVARLLRPQQHLALFQLHWLDLRYFYAGLLAEGSDRLF